MMPPFSDLRQSAVMASHGHAHGGHGHSHGGGGDDHHDDEHDGEEHGDGGDEHGDDDMPELADGSPARALHRDHDAAHDHHGHSHGAGADHGHSHGGGAHEADDEHKLDMEHDSLMAGECGGLQRGGKSKQAAAKARRGLIAVSMLCVVAICGEVAGGLYAHSLAILTDAAHLLSDLAGFLISLFALWMTTHVKASYRMSYGWHRAEILGALISVLLIWAVTGVLIWEAVERVKHPEDVDGPVMFALAAGGLCINIIMAIILSNAGHAHSHGGGGGGGHSHGGSDHAGGHGGHGGGDSEDNEREVVNVNVQSAYIHVLGDAFQSVGVMIAAAIIWYNPEWRIADPICTFVFSIIVLYTTFQLVSESVGVLMEGAPVGIDPEKVEIALSKIPSVIRVHDLHIWSLTVGKIALSAHVTVSDDAASDRGAALGAATRMLARDFNITHTTIQIELAADDIHCNPSVVSRAPIMVDAIAAAAPGPAALVAATASDSVANGKKPVYGTFR